MEAIDLTQGKLNAHIKNIAIPASIGYLFNTLFNVVDTFYAGRLSTEALAGLTISFPIFFIILSLSVGIGRGTTALCSIALGKKDKKEFNILIYNSLILGFLISIMIIIIAPIIIPVLFDLSGAKGQSKLLGVRYSKTIFYGSLFFIFNYILNAVLNAQGDTKSFRNFLIGGFLLNLILDPLLIYGWLGIPKLSTVGVAIATVIVQGIGTIYLIRKVIKSKKINIFEMKITNFSKNKIIEIFNQSLPAGLNMATIAIGVFVINYFILHFSGASTIAGYGVGVRIEQLVLLPALGLNIAVLSITGQNYGAFNLKRIKGVNKLCKRISVTMMVIGAITIFPLASWLISLFNSNIDVIREGSGYLRIEVLAIPSYVILNIIIASMQGIKKPNIAVYVGIYRQIIMPFIIFNLLGNYFNMGVFGIWWGIVIINWSAVIILLIYEKIQFNKLEKKATKLL